MVCKLRWEDELKESKSEEELIARATMISYSVGVKVIAKEVLHSGSL